MASVVASSAVVAPAAFSVASSSGSASEASSMRAFVGLKSGDVFSSKTADLSSRTVSNGSRVNCMQVWTPVDNKKFETLSYLPALSSNQIAKQIDFMLSKGWIPCLEFDKSAELKVVRGQPGFYNGRYWTMWKLPMFGCNDASSVLREVENCRKAYPNCYIRVLGFDNQRQVQCSAFIVHKPVKNALTEKLDRSLAKPAYKPQPQVSSVVTSRSGWSRDVEVYQPKDDKTVVDKINSLQAGLDGLQRELALLRASAAHDKIKILQGALDGLQREISVLRASVGHTI